MYQGENIMFPDTHSTPTETRVMMRSMHLHPGTTVLSWVVLVLFSLVGAASLSRIERQGLTPASAAGDLPALADFTSAYQPAPVFLPVTGMTSGAAVWQTYVDDFSMDLGDWSALQGSIKVQQGSLSLTPAFLGNGGTASWNLPMDLVGPSFTFAADLTPQSFSWQRFGLAINLQPDGSGLLLLIEPDTGKAAVVWRYSQGLTMIVPWQPTPSVLAAPATNHVEVICTPRLVTLRINGLEAASLPPPLPCNQGAVGVVALNPAPALNVDNASLEVHQQ